MGGKLDRRESARDPLPFSSDGLARGARRHECQVTNVPGGTAYAWRIAEPGFEMAGKTGTAQVRAYQQGRTCHTASQQ